MALSSASFLFNKSLLTQNARLDTVQRNDFTTMATFTKKKAMPNKENFKPKPTITSFQQMRDHRPVVKPSPLELAQEKQCMKNDFFM